LHFDGLPNLESLELVGFHFDLKRNDPLVNIDTSKLHRLELIHCKFEDEYTNFKEKFANLEVLKLKKIR
jgi:hypothetical protein